ncbi:MAG: glucosaminidase domain-containing protein [Bacteroidota bacterium]
MLRKLSIILPFILFFSNIQAQTYSKADIVIYISKYKQAAINKMNLYKIPASITLAQGVLESGAGSSDLATIANNHFGIKCGDNWKGDTYTKDDDQKDECFRKYSSVDDCFDDHSNFLTSKARYSDLFKLNVTDYKEWAQGLQNAGYATSKEYATRLIKLIEDYELFEYDKMYKAIIVGKKDNENQGASNGSIRIGDIEYIPIDDVNGRKIYLNNHTRFLIAKKGDTYTKIGKDFGQDEWLFVKYNDVPKGSKVKENEIVYIETKRKKASVDKHVVQDGETALSIAQFYALKIKYLYKYNNLEQDAVVRTGDTLWLKKKKEEKSASSK